jgi:hypothetical protein
VLWPAFPAVGANVSLVLLAAGLAGPVLPRSDDAALEPLAWSLDFWSAGAPPSADLDVAHAPSASASAAMAATCFMYSPLTGT